MYRDLLAEFLRQQALWERTEVPDYLTTGISVLQDHILNTKGTLRGWKVAVADHPNDEGENDDQGSKIRHQRDLLAIYRSNLAIYLKQQEHYGDGQVPPLVIHSLNDTRENIQRIKAILRGWGVAVDDLPEEESSS